MNLFDAVERRHSYRGNYKNTRVTQNDLIEIVNSGLKAPSAKNKETTEFLIINDTAVIDEINKLHSANKAMQTAKAYILCIIDKDPEPIIGNESFQLEDCSAAVENMLLTITAMGLASVWIDGWLRFENRERTIAGLVNLPKTKKIQVLLPIGYPEEEGKQPKKKDFTERVKFNNY